MLALVQSFGVLGVAIAVAVSTMLKNLMMLLAIKRLIGIWTHATLRFDRRSISALLNIE
jgi:Na+-driven multidrug efflux pump